MKSIFFGKKAGGKKFGRRRRPNFFDPFFDQNRRKMENFRNFAQKQDEIKKNPKKSSFKAGNRQKKAQANRGLDFDHFGQAHPKKNPRLS